MGKYVNPTVIDTALNKIATGVTLTVCSAQPANYTDATVTYALATAPGLTSGSYTLANGDVSGRKVTVSQQSNLAITTSGTATHVAICDSTTLLLVTTCTSQVLTSGGTVTVPAFKDEISDPV